MFDLVLNIYLWNTVDNEKYNQLFNNCFRENQNQNL